MTMRLRAGLLIAGAAATLAAGCGGAVPGLSPLGSSLTDGVNGSARTQTSKGRQIAQRSPWDVSALRNRVPKPKFGPEEPQKVDDKSVVARDVTFEAQPASGTSLSLVG